MKPSEARGRETREWLGKAAEDLASAQVLIDSNHFSGALFFCQQAAEKSLKAFLTWHERTFRRTHDLEELGKDCQAIDGTLAALLDEGCPFRLRVEAALPWGSLYTRAQGGGRHVRHRRSCLTGSAVAAAVADGHFRRS
jgi:hypothetical protein